MRSGCSLRPLPALRAFGPGCALADILAIYSHPASSSGSLVCELSHDPLSRRSDWLCAGGNGAVILEARRITFPSFMCGSAGMPTNAGACRRADPADPPSILASNLRPTWGSLSTRAIWNECFFQLVDELLPLISSGARDMYRRSFRTSVLPWQAWASTGMEVDCDPYRVATMALLTGRVRHVARI